MKKLAFFLKNVEKLGKCWFLKGETKCAFDIIHMMKLEIKNASHVLCHSFSCLIIREGYLKKIFWIWSFIIWIMVEAHFVSSFKNQHFDHYSHLKSKKAIFFKKMAIFETKNDFFSRMNHNINYRAWESSKNVKECYFLKNNFFYMLNCWAEDCLCVLQKPTFSTFFKKKGTFFKEVAIFEKKNYFFL